MELQKKFILLLPAPVLENIFLFQNQPIMNSDLIMKSDVLDIIFENRNKDYGAYNLRKFYQSRLYTSMGIMLIGVGLLFCLNFIKTDKKNDTVTFVEGPTLAPYHPAIIIAAKPIVRQATTQPVAKSIKQSVGNKIVYVKDSLKQINDQVKSLILTAVTPMNATNGVAGNSLAGTADEKSISSAPATAIDVTTPMLSPDVYPSFPGGDEALKKFLEKNLRTPGDMPDDATITVQVEFVVGYDGKLKSFTVVKDGGDDFNNEVIRVIKKMPDWIPGKSKGQNVSVYHIIPVKFVSSDVIP